MVASIRGIVRLVNDPDGDGGGLWLPNIQRSFVWSEDQICRLFDSLMRRYPINTVMFWKTKSDGPIRSFISKWEPDLKISDYKLPGNDRKKILVLDGQQRIQAMTIALHGSYDKKHLYFNVISDPSEADGDDAIAYEFRFKKDGQWPWIKVSDLAEWTNPVDRRKKAMDGSPTQLTDKEQIRIELNVSRLFEALRDEKVVKINELDSTDRNAEDYFSEDDVLEIFIRANSGGTPLGKSDLLFSLLARKWEEADEQMDDLLERVNKDQYDFKRDFVLKLSLVLLGAKAAYKVSKFRSPGFRESMVVQWRNLSDSFAAIRDFVQENTYMQDAKALPSELLLIPFIYLRFKYPTQWRKLVSTEEGKSEVAKFMARLSLAGTFAGAKDNLIDALVNEVDDAKGQLDIKAMEAAIQRNNQPIAATEARVEKAVYGSGTVRLVFSALYPSPAVYKPAYVGNSVSIDHIFPQTQLSQKVGGKMLHAKPRRDTLANLMLLTRSENSAKNDEIPETWLAKQTQEFLDKHWIPSDSRLWKLDNYEEFLEARRQLLLAHMRSIGLVESQVTSE
jgi:hypothetical protein